MNPDWSEHQRRWYALQFACSQSPRGHNLDDGFGTYGTCTRCGLVVNPPPEDTLEE